MMKVASLVVLLCLSNLFIYGTVLNSLVLSFCQSLGRPNNCVFLFKFFRHAVFQLSHFIFMLVFWLYYLVVAKLLMTMCNSSSCTMQGPPGPEGEPGLQGEPGTKVNAEDILLDNLIFFSFHMSKSEQFDSLAKQRVIQVVSH